MTRDEYNKKLQAMQEVWPESAWRFETHRSRDQTSITESRFQVYSDRWRTLGIQYRPFQPDAAYEWDEAEEIRSMARFAGGVTSDRDYGPAT